MSQDLSAFSREHEAYFEVHPYEVAVQNRGKDGSWAVRRVRAGFEVDIYGKILNGTRLPDASEYWSICTSMQKLMQSVITTDCCEVQVIAFPSTLVFDTRRQMMPVGILRIRISHGRGIEQPAGLSEQRALNEIEAKLRELGCHAPSGRAS